MCGLQRSWRPWQCRAIKDHSLGSRAETGTPSTLAAATLRSTGVDVSSHLYTPIDTTAVSTLRTSSEAVIHGAPLAMAELVEALDVRVLETTRVERHQKPVAVKHSPSYIAVERSVCNAFMSAWTPEKQRRSLHVLTLTMQSLTDAAMDYALSFGSALGVTRNGGFTPWDDDIDLTVNCHADEITRKLQKTVTWLRLDHEIVRMQLQRLVNAKKRAARGAGGMIVPVGSNLNVTDLGMRASQQPKVGRGQALCGITPATARVYRVLQGRQSLRHTPLNMPFKIFLCADGAMSLMLRGREVWETKAWPYVKLWPQLQYPVSHRDVQMGLAPWSEDTLRTHDDKNIFPSRPGLLNSECGGFDGGRANVTIRLPRNTHAHLTATYGADYTDACVSPRWDHQRQRSRQALRVRCNELNLVCASFLRCAPK